VHRVPRQALKVCRGLFSSDANLVDQVPLESSPHLYSMYITVQV
jgi:hypothetical protein